MRGITIALSLDSQVIRGFEAVQKSARPLEGRIREGAGSSPASDRSEERRGGKQCGG